VRGKWSLVDRWSRRAARDGTVGPVRPLVLEDGSAEAAAVDDEWLLGRDLLVAPIVQRGARSRSVYLPRGGSWERVTVAADGALKTTGDVGRGGTTVTAPAPLADIPLYRRVGAAARPKRDREGHDGGDRRHGGGERSDAPEVERERGGEAGAATGTRVLADGGSLPFTGLELLWGALGGLALLASGVALRRLGRSATPAQEDREHQRRDRGQHADAQHADPQHEPQDPSA